MAPLWNRLRNITIVSDAQRARCESRFTPVGNTMWKPGTFLDWIRVHPALQEATRPMHHGSPPFAESPAGTWRDTLNWIFLGESRPSGGCSVR
ncbi:hypothetical protein N7501_011898 [Penicillium viridicatum]|nr:hypothetical protein N7501_011898 [Penicillium viridicatum]